MFLVKLSFISQFLDFYFEVFKCYKFGIWSPVLLLCFPVKVEQHVLTSVFLHFALVEILK